MVDDPTVNALKENLLEGQALCKKISDVCVGHSVVSICFAVYGFFEAMEHDPQMAEAIRASRRVWDNLSTAEHN